MCSALGGPNNTFMWEIDGVMVSNSPELIIEIVSASVGGDYQCTVENSAGSGSATTTVYGELQLYQLIECACVLLQILKRAV